MAVVRAYMAHHQGMTLVALANVLTSGRRRMRARFHAEPIVQATELLLQERTPRDVAVARPRAEEVEAPAHVRRVRAAGRSATSPRPTSRSPDATCCRNGRYTVMLTAAGSGYSRCRRDTDSPSPAGARTSPATAGGPTSSSATSAERRGVVGRVSADAASSRTATTSTFSEDRAEIVRRDGAITTTLEVVVSPEDDAEVRRVSLTNLGARTREIELTSYAEVVLAPPAADRAHPAFSNLFVQTEWIPDLEALLATRGGRGPRASPGSGRRTCRRRRRGRQPAVGTATRSSRPTARGSSAADAASGRRCR